jgi:hypothetical protein
VGSEIITTGLREREKAIFDEKIILDYGEIIKEKETLEMLMKAKFNKRPEMKVSVIYTKDKHTIVAVDFGSRMQKKDMGIFKYKEKMPKVYGITPKESEGYMMRLHEYTKDTEEILETELAG